MRIDAADVVVGRTYELKTTESSHLTLTIPQSPGDTKLQVMQGLRDELIAATIDLVHSFNWFDVSTA